MRNTILLRTCLTGLVGLLGIPWLTAPLWGQAGNRNNTPLPPVVVFRSTDPVVVTPPIIVQSPIVAVPAPVVVQSPVVAIPAPMVVPPAFPAAPAYWVQRPVIDGTILAGPMTVFSPAVAAPPFATPWMPVESTTVYSPVTGYVQPPIYAPVTVFSPVVAAPPVLPPVVVATVPVGPAVVVRPKVYVQGQPVRNFFRAITP